MKNIWCILIITLVVGCTTDNKVETVDGDKIVNSYAKGFQIIETSPSQYHITVFHPQQGHILDTIHSLKKTIKPLFGIHSFAVVYARSIYKCI